MTRPFVGWPLTVLHGHDRTTEQGTGAVPAVVRLPDERFHVVLADPPWPYYGQQDKWGAAAKFYPTLTDDQIATFPMRQLMHDRSVLFLWATCPRLDRAIHAIHQWDLHYRGVAFVWIKTTKKGVPIGAQGVRPSIIKPLVELVLAASPIQLGRPLPLASEAVTQTVFAPKRAHSQKPDGIHNAIEVLYPTATKLELFARQQRPGWTAWGNEVTGGHE